MNEFVEELYLIMMFSLNGFVQNLGTQQSLTLKVGESRLHKFPIYPKALLNSDRPNNQPRKRVKRPSDSCESLIRETNAKLCFLSIMI